MKLLRWIIPFFALLAIGCGGGGDNGLVNGGGGGNGGGSGGGGGNVTAPIFATDAPNPKYSHVWVTVYSVSLVPNSGNPVNVFTSSTGFPVDLTTLHDASGQIYEFIEAAGIPAGSYKAIQLVLGKNIGFVNQGSSTITNHQITGGTDLGNGQVQLTVNLSPAFVAGADKPLVIDFDLSSWVVDASGHVHIVIREGNGNGLGDDHRHHQRPVVGVISGLNGTVGNQTFTLQHDNRSLTVNTNANTVLFNANGTPNPTLSNGERVRVVGSFVNGAFVATEIHILNGSQSGNQSEVVGTFSNLNATAGTFTVTVNHCEGFVPPQLNLNVATTANTAFFSSGGVAESQAQFFNDLANAPSGTQVEIEGTLNGNTLNASLVQLVPAGSQTGQGEKVEIGGTVSNQNANNGTFTLTAHQWQGLALQANATVNVVTNNTTTYRLNGQNATQADWFAALNGQTQVRAFGFYSNGTLTATRLAINSNNGDDNGDGGDDEDGHGHHNHGHDH
jgi:hypothetical protein